MNIAAIIDATDQVAAALISVRVMASFIGALKMLFGHRFSFSNPSCGRLFRTRLKLLTGSNGDASRRCRKRNQKPLVST
jgi:hypothetical protein